MKRTTEVLLVLLVITLAFAILSAATWLPDAPKGRCRKTWKGEGNSKHRCALHRDRGSVTRHACSCGQKIFWPD